MLASEIRVLNEAERERIHAAALEVLKKAGVAVEEEALRRDLARRGARVSVSGDVVRLPRELVDECLATVDRNPILRCVNGKTLGHRPGERHYSALVTDPYIVDYREGIRRPRLDDIARHARLGDALPLVDSIHLMDDTVPELETPVSELRCLEAFVANTTTAYQKRFLDA